MCSNLTTGGTSFDNNMSYDDEYENISNLNVKSFNETVDLLNESKLPNPISVARKQVFTENGIHRCKIAEMRGKILELESENCELKNYNKKLENEAEGLRKNLKEVTAETVKICEARIENIDLEMGNEQVESSFEVKEFRRAFEMKKLELEGWRKDQRIQELEAQLENLKKQNQKIRIQKPTVVVDRKFKKFRQIKKRES
ncbi:hypothetical protein GCK72_015996 [Caenorhabditis remanei]|uniref:Uncharacterized protein n=1 Tax=Caenorhabditis remanei TaxID=31234 RepID=A0A6A5GXY6_CAERE|nr:hypothetical protein GCK72_015996 [Caenorhabditis remanei]KAF1759529.1 hypothetical protein GCK72_015996 [Caenorhabditis remanei]